MNINIPPEVAAILSPYPVQAALNAYAMYCCEEAFNRYVGKENRIMTEQEVLGRVYASILLDEEPNYD